MAFDLSRPYDNDHKNNAYQLTLRVFREAAEQLDAIAKIAAKPATKKRLIKGGDQMMKLQELALDVIHEWEPV